MKNDILEFDGRRSDAGETEGRAASKRALPTPIAREGTITFHQHLDALQIKISSKFDFDISCAMLRGVRSCMAKDIVRSISVELTGVIQCESCAIGGTLLLAEQFPNEFKITLIDCSSMVNYIFSPALIGKYIGKTNTYSALPPTDCAGCFKSECRVPSGKSCKKNGSHA